MPAASTVALKFFDWAYSKGDKMAEELDYIPMPDAVVELVACGVEEDQGHGWQACLRDELSSRLLQRMGRTRPLLSSIFQES